MLKPIGIMGCARGEGHLARNALAQYKRYNLPLRNFPIVVFNRGRLR